jgi:hypothetical protein
LRCVSGYTRDGWSFFMQHFGRELSLAFAVRNIYGWRTWM